MSHEKLRVSKIIDELLNYFLNIGCTDINIRVKNLGEHFEIVVDVKKECIGNKEYCKLKKLLMLGKQEEMEEYYWALAGECNVDTELSIVGMMVDKVKIEEMGDDIKITLIRNK